MSDDRKIPEGLDPKKIELLDVAIDFIAKRHLNAAAVLFLESTKPLHRLAGHAAIFFDPFAQLLLPQEKYVALRECLEDPRYAEYVLERLESSESTSR
jgi:hypothetical protein